MTREFAVSFREKIIPVIKEVLGSEYDVAEYDEVLVNDYIRYYVEIKNVNAAVGKCIYIEKLADYSLHNPEKTLRELALLTVERLNEDVTAKQIDFRPWKYAREDLSLDFVDTSRNIRYLEDKVSRRFLDLSCVVMTRLDDEYGLPEFHIVTKALAEQWGVTEDTLFYVARRNMLRLTVYLLGAEYNYRTMGCSFLPEMCEKMIPSYWKGDVLISPTSNGSAYLLLSDGSEADVQRIKTVASEVRECYEEHEVVNDSVYLYIRSSKRIVKL